MRNEIIKELLNNQDLEYKKFHSKLCTTKYEIIGVRVPIVKEIAKRYSKEYGIKVIDELSNEYYEEVLVKGLIIGYSKESNEIRETYIKKFILEIDNWAICDSTISNMKFIKKDLDLFYEFITNNYQNSKDTYSLRFMIVVFLNYYLESKYIKNILNIIDNINSSEYYVNMAIAWLLSIAYIKNKEITIEYLNNNNLDKFTYNKTIQKICESYQVSKEEKELLKLKKRK